MYSPAITKNITKLNGRPMITVVFCSAVMPSVISMPRVSRPMVTDQKMRSQLGASLLMSASREVKLPSTSEPESAEVT